MKGPTRMVPVVLDEGDGVVSARGDAQEPVAADGLARRRLLRWWPVAAVAAVVLVGGQAVLDQRERAALDRVGDLPGVLLPLDASMRELWRTDDLSGMPTLRVGADIVLGVMEPDGSQAVRAVDGATGEARWEVPVADPELTRATEDEGRWRVPYCVDAKDLVVCSVNDRYEIPPDASPLSSTPEPPQPTRARLVVIDPVRHRVVAEREVAIDSPTVIAGDQVATSSTAAGTVTLEASDLRTGDVRWRRELPDAEVSPAQEEARAAVEQTLDGGAIWRQAWLNPLPDGGLVVSGQRTEWVVSATGEVLHAVARTELGDRLTHVRESTHMLTTGGAAPSVLVHPDGSRTQVSGQPLILSVDDGSAPGQCFVGDSALAAHDCETGARLWEVDVETYSGILLEGVLYLSAGAQIVAVDTALGRRLWTRELAGSEAAWGGNTLTDGRDLFVVDWQADADGQAGGAASMGEFSVVALSKSDGSQLWGAPLDMRGRRHDVWVMPVGGRLVAWQTSTPGPARVFGSG